MILIQKGGEFQLVASASGYPGWTVINQDVGPQPNDLSEIQPNGSWAIPLVKAEAFALEKIEKAADAMAGNELAHMRRQMAVMMIWQELQRLKLANATGNVPADALERAKQFPMLSALAQVYGVSLNAAANAADSRLWDNVRRMCMAEAKTQKGRDDVRAAGTANGKLAAAAAITWSE